MTLKDEASRNLMHNEFAIKRHIDLPDVEAKVTSRH